MSNKIIEVSNLSKTYQGEIKAVKNINFNVKEGEFFAFLGPNGAGKSTTIKMLTTLMKPTSGQAQIAGYDLLKEQDKIRLDIGVALQTTAIDPDLTGRELIILQGRLFGFSKNKANERAKELLELVNLLEDADRPCGNYSGGMQRRLDLALTLVHHPKIIFLDEPTAGLDPTSRISLWKEIKKLNNKYGTTIFLTTQYLEEADQVADRVCIIKEGEILIIEKQEVLKNSLALDTIKLSFSSKEERDKTKLAIEEITSNIESEERAIKIHVQNSREKLSTVIRKIAEINIFPTDIVTSSPTLDDVFLQLIKNQKNN